MENHYLPTTLPFLIQINDRALMLMQQVREHTVRTVVPGRSFGQKLPVILKPTAERYEVELEHGFYPGEPIGTLMVLSFNEGKSMIAWQGFSTKWYAEMFRNQEIMEALGNTLTIALWASVAATVVGV